MNENNKEIISKNTSLAPLSTGLASRGLQIARQFAERSHQEFSNSIGMKLVLIPKGTFMMGSPIEEEERWEVEVLHEVTISQNYYLGMTQVTQGQYEKVMGENPSHFQGNRVEGRDSSEFPVEQVSWEDAVEFSQKLSSLPEEKAAGRVYRLPTEVEWEYACRAGSNTAYCFGNDEELLSDYAWFIDNSGYQTHPVSEKNPNAWGLYDMHGNVWEWCSDWYCDYPKGTIIDPASPKEGSNRVFRGGCWSFEAASCRSALRPGGDPSDRGSNLGFRVAMNFSGIPKLPERDK
jgi:formylglycine-generating enzyme required for sulfatase activity